MSELGKRVSSAILGILLLIILVNRGGIYLSTAILAISIIGLKEFYKAVSNIGFKPYEIIGFIGTLFIYISDIYPVIQKDFVFTVSIIILLIYMLKNNEVTLDNIGITLVGILYIPFLIFHISYLQGSKYIWLVFIIAFGTDTFAYFAGNKFGKRKLCPKISPNKTVEGSIGGIIGSLILTVIFAMIMNLDALLRLMILAVISSIISQLGDLVASRIKRVSGIKDYGKLIPGHGGVLDRFDSIILVAPVIYYFVRYFL